MSLVNPFSRRLYARIWLAVVACVVIILLLVGWAWRQAQIHNERDRERERLRMQPREVLVLTPEGQQIGKAEAQPRRNPGQGFEFQVKLASGEQLVLQFPPRRLGEGGGLGPGAGFGHGRGGGQGHGGPASGMAGGGNAAAASPPFLPPDAPFWLRPPLGFFGLLAVVGLAVTLGVYPMVRRLTQRLEALQRGVQRWGQGDLSVRVPESGNDEVADLSMRFNAAAERVGALMASQQALLASQKSLLANASHELRSPLARIRMGLALMDGAATPSGAQATRAEIARNIAELDQLIDEILLASRLDAREADMGVVESVDLVGLCAEECARAGAELDVRAEPDQLIVPGVPRLLRRLVRNLLENARRYGAASADAATAGQAMALPASGAADAATRTPPPAIEVVLTRQGQTIGLQVCDRGPGVPPALRERIFEPFYRQPGASERTGGVGLGLALVKSITERHGGSVRCEARAGGGACFRVEWPASSAATQIVAQRSAE